MSSINKSPVNSNESSPSNSISLIKLDELSSFGATKQSRLPALIKLNTVDQNNQQVASNSMPGFSVSQLENQPSRSGQLQQHSLPVELSKQKTHEIEKTSAEVDSSHQAEKENVAEHAREAHQQPTRGEESDDFQVIDMQQEESADVLVGPSLPHVPGKEVPSKEQIDKSINALQSSLQLGQSTQLGDSLIEMIINLRNENQNLVRALETNNEYVKDRLSEFKRVQEDSKKREAQFAVEKAEFEHQIRKLQRQNSVLSDRLKGMEAKLKEMKLEVSESLNAANSSHTSSIRDKNEQPTLYPLIDTERESFSNAEWAAKEQDPHEATTMQVDAASGELYNEGDQQSQSGEQAPTAAEFSNMSKDELSKHFDAKKVEFYSLDDPMKQCDKLEQQLNEIGKRDYEICLLQQQLNIYRQDFRLERMQKYEAKIQIEKLKNDIDKLCLERIQSSGGESGNEQAFPTADPSSARHRLSDGLGRLSHHLPKRAAKQAAKAAAKAAKYAAKQAHLEEKAAAALARAAAVRTGATGAQPAPMTSSAPGVAPGATSQNAMPPSGYAEQAAHHYGRHHHQHRHHSHSSRPRGSGVRSEVVNDLLSTANKAMLTGYKMASTHVNLALDKLSQYEQQQASQLEKNKQQAMQTDGAKTTHAPSAPMQPPSID